MLLCKQAAFSFIVIFCRELVFSDKLRSVGSHMLRTTSLAPFCKRLSVVVRQERLRWINLFPFKVVVWSIHLLAKDIHPRQPEVVHASEVGIDEEDYVCS